MDLTELPPDVIFNILTFFKPEELKGLWTVSKKFYAALRYGTTLESESSELVGIT